MESAAFARKAAEKAVTEWTDEELVAFAKTATPRPPGVSSPAITTSCA